MNKMRNCILCHKKLGNNPLFTFENMPASAQNIPTIDEIEHDKSICLNLYQCEGCGLVQFDCEPVGYYRDVIRSIGFSSTIVELRKKQFNYLIENYKLSGKKIVEIGCGHGECLEILKEFPVYAYGIENNEQSVQYAQKLGLNVSRNYMEDKDIVIENGPFDAFISFHYLEHQPNPNDMLQGICNNLVEGGIGLIAVPSFEYVLQKDGYYELIRDHIAYYTSDTFELILKLNGFDILEKEIINEDTLSFIVKKRSIVNIANIKDSYFKVNHQINTYIDNLRTEQKKIAIWGASHQGFTLAATADLKHKIEFIIDSAPFKQGKYAPVSHIPIVSPEKAKQTKIDAIIIVAPSYSAEIARQIRMEFSNNIEISILKMHYLEILE